MLVKVFRVDCGEGPPAPGATHFGHTTLPLRSEREVRPGPVTPSPDIGSEGLRDRMLAADSVASRGGPAGGRPDRAIPGRADVGLHRLIIPLRWDDSLVVVVRLRVKIGILPE